MIDDSQTILELDRQAKNLSALGDVRLDRELAKIHKRAEALFISRGDSDLEAFFAADALVQRLLSLIACHRRRAESARQARDHDGERLL